MHCGRRDHSKLCLYMHNRKVEEADDERVSASGGDIGAVVPSSGAVV